MQNWKKIKRGYMVLIVQYNTIETAGYFIKILQKYGVDYNIIDLEKGDKLPKNFTHSHLICMGGYDSVYDDIFRINTEMEFIRESIDKNIPYFGVCLGAQFLAKIANAEVCRCEKGEHGFKEYKNFIIKDDPIFYGFDKSEFHNFHIHNDCIKTNEHLVQLCKGNDYDVQMIKFKDNCYGIQGHIEIEEDKLQIWLKADKDLKKLDYELELKRYHQLKNELESTAEIFISNFLKYPLTLSPHK